MVDEGLMGNGPTLPNWRPLRLSEQRSIREDGHGHVDSAQMQMIDEKDTTVRTIVILLQ
jgi:hypothetical protein